MSRQMNKAMNRPMAKSLAPLLKFALVGGTNTGIDFLVFTLLTFLGWAYFPAQCVSFTCGVLNSYVLNRSWTFRDCTASGRLLFYKFVALNALVLLLVSGLIALFHQGAGWPVLVSKFAASFFGVLVNFAGNRVWVFRSDQTV
jgi:putative flippase GtrA